MAAKVNPGDPLRLSALMHNDTVDMLAWWKRNYGTVGANQPKPGAKYPDNATRIFLKNNSAANRRQGEVLKIGSIVSTDVKWKGLNYFAGTIPESVNDQFAVLLEPITYSSNEVGMCQIMGVMPAWVNIQTEGDRYADVDGTTAVLQSGSSGRAEILYAPSGTGEKQCVILLDRSSTPNFCEYRTSYCKEESWVESGVTRYRWLDFSGAGKSGDACSIFDSNGYANNTLQTSQIGLGSWFFKHVYGNPSQVGIVHDDTVTGDDIFETGNFDVLSDGYYEFELHLKRDILYYDETKLIQFESANTGTTSSHTHTYDRPTKNDYFLSAGVYMFREGDTVISATNQAYADEFGIFRGLYRAYCSAEFQVFAGPSTETQTVIFRANLDAGDRIAFRPNCSQLAKYQVREIQLNYKCTSLKITNLGAKRTPVDLTA